MLKLSVYIPAFALEDVKTALFEAGAGESGHYDRCCWVLKGEGQFRPLAGSNPSIGEIGVTEQVVEYKLEILVPERLAAEAVAAVRRSHPYEAPAFDFIKLYEPEW